MPSVRFGTDGIRGIAGESLSDSVAFALGAALAERFPDGTMLIGRDTRPSGAGLSAALAAGVNAFGANAVDLGVIPTPGLASVVFGEPTASCGVVVTASHNPVEYNGLKVLGRDGRKIDDAVERGAVHREVADQREGGGAPRLDDDGLATPLLGNESVLRNLLEHPIGIGVGNFWKSAMAGQSGISAITSFDPFPMDGYRSKVAGQVRGFSPEQHIGSAHGDRVDRYAQFALAASREALSDSGMRMDQESPHRVGVIVGAGMGGMVMGEREITQLYLHQKPHRVHPNFIPVITLNSASGIVAMATGAKGPNFTISTACSSSAHALGQALYCIRTGQDDAVIVVGADASITPLVFAGFCSLRALSSKFNDQPERASRLGD